MNSKLELKKMRTLPEENSFAEVEDRLSANAKRDAGAPAEIIRFLYKNHLYERVPYSQIRKHLEKKGIKLSSDTAFNHAINVAIRDLKWYDANFELLKIQDSARTMLQLNFRKIQSVLTPDEYHSYATHLLNKCKKGAGKLLIVGNTNEFEEQPSDEWKKKESNIQYDKAWDAFKFNNHMQEIRNSFRFIEEKNRKYNTTYRFLPYNMAVPNYLLIFEDENQKLPFCAFQTNGYIFKHQQLGHGYMVIRGDQRQSELQFLEDTWDRLWDLSLNLDEIVEIKNQAVLMLQKKSFLLKNGDDTFDTEAVMRMLVAEKVRKKVIDTCGEE